MPLRGLLVFYRRNRELHGSHQSDWGLVELVGTKEAKMSMQDERGAPYDAYFAADRDAQPPLMNNPG